MEGFTALTQSLGPEEAYAVMDQVYEILIHKVHDFVEQYGNVIPDNVLKAYNRLKELYNFQLEQ